MARIRFLSEQVFENGGIGKGPKFPKGFVLDAENVGNVLGTAVTPEYAEGFLNRWINRGVAEFVRADARVSPSDEVVEAPGSEPVVVQQPFGIELHGRPAEGLDDGKQAGSTKPSDLSSLTRAELEKLAADSEVDVSKAKNKADIISAIEAAAKE